MNQLTQVRIQPGAPPIDKSSDEVEMAGRKWRWTMEVKQTPIESIRRIEVSVRAAEAPDKSSLAYVSGFYGTAIAPAGMTLVSWRGNKPGGGGGKQGERRRDSETEPPPQTPLEPGEPVPPEPEPPGEDPSS
jgi:hypothetical protein